MRLHLGQFAMAAAAAGAVASVISWTFDGFMSKELSAGIRIAGILLIAVGGILILGLVRQGIKEDLEVSRKRLAEF